MALSWTANTTKQTANTTLIINLKTTVMISNQSFPHKSHFIFDGESIMRLIWSAVFSALFSTLTFGLSFSVHAASFDCAKAATAPEK